MAAPAVTGPGHGEMTELDGLQLKCNQVIMIMMIMGMRRRKMTIISDDR